MLATIGLQIAAALSVVATFLCVVAACQRYGVGLLVGLRAASSPGWLERSRALALLRLRSLASRWISPVWLRHLRLAIIRAGAPGGMEPEEVIGLQLLCAAAFGIVGAAVGWAIGTLFQMILFGLLLALVYPLIWLREQIKRRQLKIGRELPFSLDLLTLSVEAGLDFNGALGKVVEKGRPGPLPDELALVLKELRMGRSREEALKELVPRTDLASIRSFVTALVQADRMGTSLGKILRLQASQLRIERTQRAEKLAGEAPVRMLFPLIACVFPTVFLVLFGPIVFAIMFGEIGG